MLLKNFYVEFGLIKLASNKKYQYFKKKRDNVNSRIKFIEEKILI